MLPPEVDRQDRLARLLGPLPEPLPDLVLMPLQGKPVQKCGLLNGAELQYNLAPGPLLVASLNVGIVFT